MPIKWQQTTRQNVCQDEKEKEPGKRRFEQMVRLPLANQRRPYWLSAATRFAFIDSRLLTHSTRPPTNDNPVKRKTAHIQ